LTFDGVTGGKRGREAARASLHEREGTLIPQYVMLCKLCDLRSSFWQHLYILTLWW